MQLYLVLSGWSQLVCGHGPHPHPSPQNSPPVEQFSLCGVSTVVISPHNMVLLWSSSVFVVCPQGKNLKMDAPVCVSLVMFYHNTVILCSSSVFVV